MRENDLLKRTFDFGVNVILHLRLLPETTELKVIKYQLIKASTSIGANYEEAQAGSSKADFINKVNIALKEARESLEATGLMRSYVKEGNVCGNLIDSRK